MSYWKAVFIALDQLINALLKGWPDETLSSRCYRLSKRGITWPMKAVDTIFFWEKDHCRDSYDSERLGRQLPPECRVDAKRS